jgi:4'-phosphopantetheinyl transferase
MSPDEIHLWWCSPDEIADTARLKRLLSDQERARRRRFQHAHTRHDFVVSHALLRTTLSRYLDRAPEELRFRTGPRGRPEIEGNAGTPPLRFNLSHTRDLVLLGVTRGHDIGVDAEDTRQETDALSLSKRFAAQEHEHLASLPPEDRQRHFFELWTLKEACAKACGEGLYIPLDTFHFRFDGPRLISEFDDDPAAWQLHQFWPTPHHVAAAAVRRPREHPVAFTVQRAKL